MPGKNVVARHIIDEKEKAKFDYIFQHKRTREEFGTNDKKHASTVLKSPSWTAIKKPK